MTIYRTNSITKLYILEEAKKLFYDNGYKNTSISQIANSLDISKGLITYHFKTKFHLANTVYDDYRIDLLHVLTDKIKKIQPNLNPIYYDDIQLRTVFRLYKSDYNARRFYMEIAPELLMHSLKSHYHIIYGPKAHYHHLNLNYDEQEDLLMQYASSAGITAIRLAYFRGEVKSSYEFAEDSCTTTMARLLKFDEEMIHDMITIGKEVANSLDIKFEPYFKIV